MRFVRTFVLAVMSVVPRAALDAQPARFADPRRAEKLAAAYGTIDSLFRAYAARDHVPGAAWAVVVDGRVAHTGVTGVRDVASKAPVDVNTDESS